MVLINDTTLREGAEGKPDSERPTIYMAGPTPQNEANLGPIMEQVVRNFWNRADFFDPASIHEAGGGGGEDGDLIDINDNSFWDDYGAFKTRKFMSAKAEKEDDDKLFDAMDEIIEIPDIDPDFHDIPFIDLDWNPAPPTPFFELDLLDIPFIDISLIGTDLKMGMLKWILNNMFSNLSKADGIMVSRKENENMFGAALEVYEAKKKGIPVAVYDHDSHTSGQIPTALDAHADYVTDNPNWAASWLINEAERRKEKEEQGEPHTQEVVYPTKNPS